MVGKYGVAGVCILGSITFLHLYIFSYDNNAVVIDRNQDILATKTTNKKGKLRYILYWNDFYGSKNFGFCCGRSPYKKYR